MISDFPFRPKIFCPPVLSYCDVLTGAKEDDYEVDNELNKVIVAESAREADETKEATEAREPEEPEKFTSLADSSEKSGLGSISFVSCATGAEAIEPPSLVSEAEEGELLFMFVWDSLRIVWVSLNFPLTFLSFLSEAKPRLTKETAVELGTFFVLFCLFVFCFFALHLTLAVWD